MAESRLALLFRLFAVALVCVVRSLFSSSRGLFGFWLLFGSVFFSSWRLFGFRLLSRSFLFDSLFFSSWRLFGFGNRLLGGGFSSGGRCLGFGGGRSTGGGTLR